MDDTYMVRLLPYMGMLAQNMTKLQPNSNYTEHSYSTYTQTQ